MAQNIQIRVSSKGWLYGSATAINLQLRVVGGGGGSGGGSGISSIKTATKSPTIKSVVPQTIKIPKPKITIVVVGSNFTRQSKIQINGADKPTTFVSAATLRTQILASELAGMTSASVTVSTDGNISPPFQVRIE